MSNLAAPTALLPVPDVGLAARRAARRVGSSTIRDLLRLTGRPEIISLAGGLPDPSTLPAAAIAAAVAQLLAADPAAALQYAPTEGDPALRSWILDRRHAAVGQDVIITHGSQQALDLIVRATVEPGDTAVVADPAYVGALQVLRLARARVVGVPTDRSGLDTDVLETRLRSGLRPRLVITVSSFHNPTGATMDEGRRRHLADLACRYGFVVVDDDPYGDLRWAGTAPTSLAALSDRVITLGTFSKILSPGLRVGYAVGPTELIGDLTVLKQAADLQTSTLNQAIVTAVVTRPGFLDDHLGQLRRVYRTRASVLASALVEYVGDRLTFDPVDGGMFLWATASDPCVDADELLHAALRRGVAFVPGTAFAVDRDLRGSLRLSFATAGPDELGLAAKRLALAFADAG